MEATDPCVRVYRINRTCVVAIPKQIIREMCWEVGDLLLILPYEYGVSLTRINKNEKFIREFTRRLRFYRSRYEVIIPPMARDFLEEYAYIKIVGKETLLLINDYDYENPKNLRSVPKPTKWSKEEEELLIKYYPYVPNRILAEVLGKTRHSIVHKAYRHKLRKVYRDYPERLVKFDRWIEEFKKEAEKLLGKKT